MAAGRGLPQRAGAVTFEKRRFSSHLIRAESRRAMITSGLKGRKQSLPLFAGCRRSRRRAERLKSNGIISELSTRK